MSSAFGVCCIYSSALQTRFYHGSKQYDPLLDEVGSLILGHITCNIGYLRLQAEERSDDKSRDWWEKGKEIRMRCTKMGSLEESFK